MNAVISWLRRVHPPWLLPAVVFIWTAGLGLFQRAVTWPVVLALAILSVCAYYMGRVVEMRASVLWTRRLMEREQEFIGQYVQLLSKYRAVRDRHFEMTGEYFEGGPDVDPDKRYQA